MPYSIKTWNDRGSSKKCPTVIRVPQWCRYPRLMEVYDCGNYRVTVNPVMKVRQFPVPTYEDLFGTLTGETSFTKLHLPLAYLFFCLLLIM